MAVLASGVLPVQKDHRDRSYPRTFGSVATFPDELNLDWSKRFPDQLADGRPQGCTGYTQSEICQDEDRREYDPGFTYDMTRHMEGTYPDPVPCQIRTSLKSTISYGVRGAKELDDQAAGNRRGAYYNVVDSPDLDAFDDVRSAILTNKRTVSAATPWFDSWNRVRSTGILAEPDALVGYHNWKICGWKLIKGTPYLIGKPWQGEDFGDDGYVYISRETFNKVMTFPGVGCFTVRAFNTDDAFNVKLTILDTILSYYRLILAKYLIGLWSKPS